MEIVPALESHIPEIVGIWKEFMEFHGETSSFLMRKGYEPKNFSKHVRSSIESDYSQVLVALDGDRVAAYSISRMDENPPADPRERCGLISDMAVRPTHQEMGISERMLAMMFDWFESHNLGKIELHVVAGNQAEESFWERHGFEDYVYIGRLDE